MCAEKSNPEDQVAVPEEQSEERMSPLDVHDEKSTMERIVLQASQVETDEDRRAGLDTLLEKIRKSDDRSEYLCLFDEAVQKYASLRACIDRHNSPEKYRNAMGYVRMGISQSFVQTSQWQIENSINANNRKYEVITIRLQENEQQNQRDNTRLKENLRQQVQAWDEDKAALRKELRRLKEENKELVEQLDLRDNEIKGLQKQLAQLKEENRELEKELQKVKCNLNDVQSEMETLNNDVTNLKQENCKLQNSVDETQQEFNDFRASTTHQMVTLHNELEKAKAKNTEDISESDNYVIALSEVYTKLQTSMYKKVHPTLLLGKQTQRTVTELKKHLASKYRNNPGEKDQAGKRWDELQAQLDWDDDYMDAIKDIKRMRHTAAHPSFDEDMIPGYVGYVTKLQREGSISDDLAQQAEALVNMFCKLKDLGI